MIYVVNRAMGLIDGGGEIFDKEIIRNILSDYGPINIFCGGINVEKEFSQDDSDVTAIACRSPFLRKLAYKLPLRSKLGALLYILDNLIFELCFVFYFLFKTKTSQQPKIVYCCSLFIIPLILSRYFRNVQFFTWLPGPPGKFAVFLIRRLLNRTNFNLFTNGYPEKTLNELGLIEGKDYFFMPPALNTVFNLSKPQKTHSSDLIRGVTVARLVPIKDLSFLLRCLARCKQAGLRFSWNIVGDGPDKKTLQATIYELDIADIVTISGRKSQSEINTILSTSHVFALSSSFENYSIAVLEAFSKGLPGILRNVGYLPRMIDGGRRGFNFDTEADFVEALKTLRYDRALYKKISQNCSDFASQHNWEINREIFHRQVLKKQMIDHK